MHQNQCFIIVLISSVLPILCFCFQLAFASIGDQSPNFRQCVSLCANQHGCPPKHTQFAWWAREECFKCRQRCIWSTVEQFHHHGRKTPQFNGKWPFLPITMHFGRTFVAIQEPASVAFSLLNAFTVWLMQKRVRFEVRPEWYCRGVWLNFGQVGMLTWFCSALFHCCDHWLTEMLDYCSAFGLILYTLFASICFVLPHWNNLAGIRPSQRFFGPIGLGLLFFYLRYLHSLYSAPYFDYAFHIRCCLQIAMFTGALFLCWTFWECRKGQARHSMLILGATFAIGWFSAAFDALFDFPPLFSIFDAHSLFHLFSAPVPLLWAEFICQEANGFGKPEKMGEHRE